MLHYGVSFMGYLLGAYLKIFRIECVLNTMQRRQFLALIGFAGLIRCTRRTAQAQPPLFTKPVPKILLPRIHKFVPPLKQELPPLSEERLPIAQIPPSFVGEIQGRPFYTRRTNQASCYYFADKGNVEWVGTKYGIKRIDKRREEVRLYTLPEGKWPQANTRGNRSLSMIYIP